MNIKMHVLCVPSVSKVGIYAIHNKKNNKYYIGSSVNIENRMKSHRSNLERKRGLNKKIEQDLLRSGNICDFEFIVLETFEDQEITETQLRNRELDYIKQYDAYNGYNTENPLINRYLDNNCMRLK